MSFMTALFQDIDSDPPFLHRFGDIIVHAGFQALLTIACQGVGCDDHDFWSLSPKPAYFPGSLEVAHLRHLYIHENEIVRLPFQGLESLVSIGH